MSIKENSIITKKDLRKNWLTWLSICCLSNNWERMQNIDYDGSMAPILKKLYPDDNEKFSERLSSHMEFFNTQPTAGLPDQRHGHCHGRRKGHGQGHSR